MVAESNSHIPEIADLKKRKNMMGDITKLPIYKWRYFPIRQNREYTYGIWNTEVLDLKKMERVIVASEHILK